MFIIILCLLSTIISLWQNQRLLGGGGIYLIASNALIILFTLILIWSKRKKIIDSYIHKVIYLFLACHTLQVFILYEIACQYSDTSSMAQDIFLTLFLEGIVFIVFFIIGKYFKITLFKLASLISFIALPLSIIAITLGNKSRGSYFILKIGPFSVVSLAIISLLMPFTLAFAIDVFKDWWHTHLKIYHLMLLIYFGFISLLLVRNKDLGSLLILSATLLIVVLPTLPNFWYKASLVLTSVFAVITLYFFSDTFEGRFKEIIEVKGNTLYFLQQYKRAGFWGNGYQHIKLNKIPHLDKDYALNCVFSNHGLLLTIALLILIMILLQVSYSMIFVIHHNNFIEILLKSSLLTIAIPYVYCALASLLLVPVTGIIFPFLGNSTSLGLVYTYNIALILGFYSRKEHLL